MGVMTGYRTCTVEGCTRRAKDGWYCWDCRDGRGPGVNEKRLRVLVSEDEAEEAAERVEAGEALGAVADEMGIRTVALMKAVRPVQRRRLRAS